ncbi:MAG: T9SS type A sorting domain-containing protein [Bacteroidia bacterium]|nr:T9SS type A sorting domain-containing protein [Bacteroidia bacterium]
MNKLLTLCFLGLLCLKTLFLPAQLTVPQAEAVYGGRINAITGIQTAADSSRIFITTESANSAFYADVYHPTPDSAVFGAFQLMPDMGSTANLGSGIRDIAAHAGSRSLIFMRNPGQLARAAASGGGLVNIGPANVQSFAVYGDYLLALSGNRLHYGTLDLTGAYTESAGSPLLLTMPPGPSPALSVHPGTGHIYMYIRGNTPKVARSSDPYTSLNSGTTFADISPATLPATFEWTALGIAPDGRLFVGGSDFAHKKIAYSDDEVTWTYFDLPFGGAPGSNIAFSGDSSLYAVYFASAYNLNKGVSGSWFGFGSPGGFETHPNDGAVYADPAGKKVVYMTTDQGIGASLNGGSRIFEINEGVEAVQVNDFSMHLSNKNVAWIASKAGIRKVSSYQSTPAWTPAIFPNGDGSPYYAAAMAGTDTNTVYVGNLRVYKSGNGGTTWRNMFSAEVAPYNFNAMGTPATGAAAITSLAVCEWDTSLVMAGYTIDQGDEGGLFYSLDGGQTWGQVLMEATVVGKDVDVQDIVFNIESGDTVAYVGVHYDLSSPQGHSVYRLVKSGSGWTPSQDMGPGGTSTGATIVASVVDLHRSATGDTLVACGTDAGNNHPIAYHKILSAGGKWTPFPTNGFPFMPGKKGKAITIGIDTVYVAVDNELYYLAAGGTAWTQGYVYPAGAQIHFIFYDELLVGTGTGLYGHQGPAQTSNGIGGPSVPVRSLQLYPNPARTGEVNITFGGPGQKPALLLIRNTMGQIVYRRAGIRGQQVAVSTEELPGPGLYIVEVRVQGAKYVGKLIVQ